MMKLIVTYLAFSNLFLTSSLKELILNHEENLSLQ